MKILLVDDHKLIKIAMAVLLEEYNYDIDSCSSYDECIELLKVNSYDLIICDISLPEKSGYDILSYIKEADINSKVIMMSMHDDDSYIKKALKLGAKGYVTKSSAHEEILDAIKVVFEDKKIYLNVKYAHILFDLYQEKETQSLSEREEEVLKYMAEGYTLTEIGQKLFLSVKTVDTYKRRLMEKTNSTSRVDLINYYKENYLLS